MKIGDCITFDYDVYNVEKNGDEELIETSREAIAKAAEIHEEGENYSPMATVVGKGRVLEALDNHLMTMKVGERKAVIFPPEDAHGPIKDSLKVFLKQKEARKAGLDISKLKAGMAVMYKSKPHIVRKVSRDRIQLDGNHPLAGKTLKYDVQVRTKAETPEDQVKILLRGCGYAPKDFVIDIEGNTLNLTIPEYVAAHEQFFKIFKFRLVADMKSFTGIETVRYIEAHEEQESEENGDANRERSVEGRLVTSF